MSDLREAVDVSSLIRNARRSRQMSQTTLALAMDGHQGFLGRLEQRGANPTVATLQRIADALDLRLVISFVEESQR